MNNILLQSESALEQSYEWIRVLLLRVIIINNKPQTRFAVFFH